MTAAGLTEFGRPEGYLPRQLARWTQQWELTQTRPLPVMDALRQRLGADLSTLPDDQPWGLVHGDYRLDNVMLAQEGADVRAVLDWEMSTLGHPLADLGLTLVYWTEPTDTLRRRIPVAERLTDATGFWDRRRIIDAYADASGLPMDRLDTCTALACFKLAVITESILARTLMGKQLGVGAGARRGHGGGHRVARRTRAAGARVRRRRRLVLLAAPPPPPHPIPSLLREWPAVAAPSPRRTATAGHSRRRERGGVPRWLRSGATRWARFATRPGSPARCPRT